MRRSDLFAIIILAIALVVVFVLTVGMIGAGVDWLGSHIRVVR